jgi:ribosomal protein L16 Arg81 hydroxylase
MLSEFEISQIARSDIVVNRKSLLIKSAVRRIIREMREEEIREIITKEQERCRRLIAQKQD